MKVSHKGVMFVVAETIFALCASSQPQSDQSKQSGGQADNSPPYTSASCPVTKRSDSSFVPPAPYPAQVPNGGFFFGTRKLWTLLWPDWQRTTNGGNKTAWWREGYDGKDPQPKLVITGHRMDTNDPPVVVTNYGNGAISGQPFITASVPLPGPGCWQVTARLYGAGLTFVVWLDK